LIILNRYVGGNVMKKIFVMFIVAELLIFGGCGQKEAVDATPQVPEVVQEEKSVVEEDKQDEASAQLYLDETIAELEKVVNIENLDIAGWIMESYAGHKSTNFTVENIGTPKKAAVFVCFNSIIFLNYSPMQDTFLIEGEQPRLSLVEIVTKSCSDYELYIGDDMLEAIDIIKEQVGYEGQ
jgi:hypothetical protein